MSEKFIPRKLERKVDVPEPLSSCGHHTVVKLAMIEPYPILAISQSHTRFLLFEFLVAHQTFWKFSEQLKWTKQVVTKSETWFLVCMPTKLTVKRASSFGLLTVS